jgi:dephospho-CoA kinase
MPSSPVCIGLTGGIGSGKSAALQAFQRRGAAVCSADDVVHALYGDPVIIDAVQQRFGPGVIASDGRVDRAALGHQAMAADGGMRFLEELLHPRIAEARLQWIARQRALVPNPPLLVCEVPLLFEAGLEDQFDAIVVVTASESVRRARVSKRGQDFDARAALQWPEDQKVRGADESYVNDGTEAALDAWIGEVFGRWAADGPR